MASKREVRGVKVYEDTARLVEEIIRRSKPGTTFADVIEAWAKEIHPKTYGLTQRSQSEIDKAIADDTSGEMLPPTNQLVAPIPA